MPFRLCWSTALIQMCPTGYEQRACVVVADCCLQTGQTALHIACQYQLAAVPMLLAHPQMAVNQRDSVCIALVVLHNQAPCLVQMGRTALHIATLHHGNVVEALLQAGADHAIADTVAVSGSRRRSVWTIARRKQNILPLHLAAEHQPLAVAVRWKGYFGGMTSDV